MNNNVYNKAKEDFYLCIDKSNYKVIGEYQGACKKILINCNNGHSWEVTPSHFRNGVRCPQCQGRTSEQAEKRFLKAISEEGYKCFDKYSGNKVKVKVECPNGHIYSVRPNDFMTGHRCRSCSISMSKEIINRKKKSYEDLKIIANSRGFEIIGNYINTNTKIYMKCPNGHIHNYNIDHFKSGSGCPICNCNSIGEKTVISMFINNCIEFEFQKTFNNLTGINGGNLRFDFYLPEFNTAIEIQGEHHYEKSQYFSKNTFEHDTYKKEFCIKNNIKLVSIPYCPTKFGKRKALLQLQTEVLSTINSLI